MEFLLDTIEPDSFQIYEEESYSLRDAFDFGVDLAHTSNVVLGSLASEKLTSEKLDELCSYFNQYYDLFRDKIKDEFLIRPVETEKICTSLLSHIVNRLNKVGSIKQEYEGLDGKKKSRFEIFYYGYVLMAIYHLRRYCPNYEYKIEVLDDSEVKEEVLNNISTDKRRTNKVPPNKDRIKALKTLAPELWDKLVKSQDTKIQQKTVYFITGVNWDDSYKYSFGDRQNEVDKREVEGLDELIEKLT